MEAGTAEARIYVSNFRLQINGGCRRSSKIIVEPIRMGTNSRPSTKIYFINIKLNIFLNSTREYMTEQQNDINILRMLSKK